MQGVGILAAFVAGLLSFLSPCVLPLVPGYVSFVSGFTLEQLTRGPSERLHARAALASLFFVLGFSLVFVLLGASASLAGQWLAAYKAPLSTAAGALVMLFGLHTMGVLPLRWLYLEKRFKTGGLAPGLGGAFLMGLAFAFGWTPCIGPILAGILALAARDASAQRGMLLLGVYSLGLGIPFILTGFATASFMRFFQGYKRYIRWGEILAGLLLVLVGFLILSRRLSILIGFLPSRLFDFAL